MRKFMQQIVQVSSGVLYLVRGEAEGFPLWHYVLVDALKLPLFVKQLHTQNMDVARYGRILASGWGEDPPDQIQNAVLSKAV
jgi:hypothetical protein